MFKHKRNRDSNRCRQPHPSLSLDHPQWPSNNFKAYLQSIKYPLMEAAMTKASVVGHPIGFISCYPRPPNWNSFERKPHRHNHRTGEDTSPMRVLLLWLPITQKTEQWQSKKKGLNLDWRQHALILFFLFMGSSSAPTNEINSVREVND